MEVLPSSLQIHRWILFCVGFVVLAISVICLMVVFGAKSTLPSIAGAQTFELVSGSTITGLESAWPTHSPEPLTGTFTFGTGDQPGSCSAKLESKSYVLTSVAKPQTAVNPRMFSFTFHTRDGTEVDGVELGEADFLGSCPETVSFSDVHLAGPSGEWQFILNIQAVRIDPPRPLRARIREGFHHFVKQWKGIFPTEVARVRSVPLVPRTIDLKDGKSYWRGQL